MKFDCRYWSEACRNFSGEMFLEALPNLELFFFDKDIVDELSTFA